MAVRRLASSSRRPAPCFLASASSDVRRDISSSRDPIVRSCSACSPRTSSSVRDSSSRSWPAALSSQRIPSSWASLSAMARSISPALLSIAATCVRSDAISSSYLPCRSRRSAASFSASLWCSVPHTSQLGSSRPSISLSLPHCRHLNSCVFTQLSSSPRSSSTCPCIATISSSRSPMAVRRLASSSRRPAPCFLASASSDVRRDISSSRSAIVCSRSARC